MSSNNFYLVLLFVAFAYHKASGHTHMWMRKARSPDTTLELAIPDYSPDFGDHKDMYDKETDEQKEYWQNQLEKSETDYENAKQNNDREEKYEKEKEHHETQSDKYRNEANENYNNNLENFQSHHASNEEHFGNHNVDNNIDSKREEFKADAAHKYDKYGEKGEDAMNNEREKMENYNAEGKRPSFNYTVA